MYLQNNRLEIINYVLTELTGYPDMVIRPYEVTAREADVAALADEITDKLIYGTTTPFDISGAGSLISISNKPLATPDIANGWQEHRWSFVITTREVDPYSGSVRIAQYKGYSDHADKARNVMVDPNVLMHINSVTTHTQITTATGEVITSNVKTFNVIGNDNIGNEDVFADNLMTARPVDIISSMVLAEMYDASTSITDPRNVVGATLITSDGNNNDASAYTAKLISAFAKSKSASNISTDRIDMMRTAATIAKEPTYDSLGLITELAAVHEGGYNLSPTVFTENTLISIFGFNAVDSVKKVCPYEPPVVTRGNQYSAMDSESWMSGSPETLAATTLLHSISARLAACSLGGAEIVIDTTDQYKPINVIDCQTMIRMSPAQTNNSVLGIITYLEHVLLPKITNNYVFNIIAHISIRNVSSGNCLIQIPEYGTGPVPYTMASFADSLFIPIITDTGTNQALTTAMGGIMDVVDAHQEHPGVYIDNNHPEQFSRSSTPRTSSNTRTTYGARTRHGNDAADVPWNTKHIY